nr:hypothetical protein Itr_chr15CG04770 [Ipomoea trifida]
MFFLALKDPSLSILRLGTLVWVNPRKYNSFTILLNQKQIPKMILSYFGFLENKVVHL